MFVFVAVEARIRTLTRIHRQITGYQPYVVYVLVPVVLGLRHFSPKFGVFLLCVVATPASVNEEVSIIIRL